MSNFKKTFRVSPGTLLILSVSVVYFASVLAQKGKPNDDEDTTVRTAPIQFHEDFRPIQWCVNGQDEPEFQKYPWNEFVPILQRKYYDYFQANLRYKYGVDLWPIKVSLTSPKTSTLGSGGNLYQRAHFVFKVELRRKFEEGVNLEYNNTEIEGLLVQVNFAPYGVGMPIGQFSHPKEFNCVDCRKPVGIPIACRRRTHMHIVHPTLMAYHHKMKIDQREKDRQRRHCYNQITPLQCILTGFKHNADPRNNVSGYAYKWEDTYKEHLYKPFPGFTSECNSDADCSKKITSWFTTDCCVSTDNGMCNITSSDEDGVPADEPIKKFCPNINAAETDILLDDPVLQSIDWPEFACKPFEVTVCRPVGYPTIPRYETMEDLQIDYTLPSPTPYKPLPEQTFGFDPFSPDQQCCLAQPGSEPCPPPLPNAPPGPPPGAKRCPKSDPDQDIPPTECIPRVVPPLNRNQNPWVQQFNGEKASAQCSDLLQEDDYGSSNEVHGNFVWYVPPCRKTPVKTRFQLLIVHSFHRGIYSVIERIDHVCETATSSAEYIFTKSFQKKSFDFSRSYDACVQNITGPKYVNDQFCPGVPNFTPATAKRKGKKPAKVAYANRLTPKCDTLNPIKLNILDCESECPKLPSTTLEYVRTPSNRIIKRTLHGGINIVTNFCIMPICVFIARFYKETYNLKSYKGQKYWYWMHMLGAGGSTLFMYMGYFTEKLVDETDAHLVNGNLYIICLALSYIAAWMRHKNRWISMIVESTHSVCGYSCFMLALICVTNAKQQGEPINNAVKYVVYAAIASLTVFYVGMTVHICSLDKKFGMKPQRWHFPSVEARFDDLPVPGRNVRKIFIFAVLFINLPLTLSTLFL